MSRRIIQDLSFTPLVSGCGRGFSPTTPISFSRKQPSPRKDLCPAGHRANPFNSPPPHTQTRRVLVNVATPWIRKESKHGARVRRDQAREAAGHAGDETREAPGPGARRHELHLGRPTPDTRAWTSAPPSPACAAMEPDDRPRKTPDHTKPSGKTLEPTDDTATSTPTDTINTNCQQRRCNDH